jgi:anti-sigma regulatory factor (Ser/Thr protein kinase)
LIGGSTDFAFRLNGGLDAGARARRAVVERDGALPPAVRQDVLLLVTELVTNAVRHAAVGPDRPVYVEVRRWRRRVRVEVADRGAGFAALPKPRRPSEGPGGWGLFLVERLADRWGADPASPGTCVWFEIDFEG